jgi:predicted nucleic-acid-binding Zn-ribbon protein
MKKGKCPKCGSENLDTGHIIGESIGYESDNECYFTGPMREFKVNLCSDCGYAEFYVNIENRKKVEGGKK